MGILGFETRNTAQGIRNWIQYPNSTDKDWNLVHGIHSPRLSYNLNLISYMEREYASFR